MKLKTIKSLALAAVLGLTNMATTAWSADSSATKASTAQTQSKQAQIEKININKADAAAIAATLNGVGPAKAKAIVEFRKANGTFKSLEEITQVKGIGGSTVAKNKNLIKF